MSDLALLTIPAFAIADRLFGADKPAFPGKKAAILALACGAGYLAGSWFGLALAGIWFAYRSAPFFGGSGAPQSSSQLANAALRHGMVVPLTALAAHLIGADPRMTAIVFGVYALLAFGLAAYYGKVTAQHIEDGEPGGGENAAVEVLRGALYGGAIYALVAGGL